MKLHTASTFIWPTMLAGLLGLMACSRANSSTPKPEQINAQARLASFSGAQACQDLEQYIEDTAVLQMKTDLEAQRDGVPGWGWWGGGFAGRGGPEGDLASPSSAGAANGAEKAAPSDHSTTNTQVAGVDEADFVKNDGTRIFVLSGNNLYLSQSWPAADLGLKGKLKISGYPTEMFLADDNRLVIFSNVYRRYALGEELGEGWCGGPFGCDYSYGNTVLTTVVDVSDMTQPTVVASYEVPGSYVSSRRIGKSVRLVLSDAFRYPSSVRFWPDDPSGNIWNDQGLRTRAYNDLIAQNETLIRAGGLADWLPNGKKIVGGQSSDLPFSCSDFSKVTAPTRLGLVTVATLNLDDLNSFQRNSILAESGEVYSSSKNLYVATRHWWWWPAPGQKDTTYLHKFDLSDASAARYLASGLVDGTIADQFSMDENSQGYFRVATTIAQRVPDQEFPENWWGQVELVNRVSVLADNGLTLEVVGQSEDLAKGERITSARFFEDKAFVVTFRNVDPLFSFDMSDPFQPKKMGELKIPGFSSYIHPLDANHLLTIGTYQPEPDANGNVDWESRSIQLAIFDVGDLSNPKQTFTHAVGSFSSYSEAQWDHKAFNYLAAKKLLAIPYIDWSYDYNGSDYWSHFKSELRVFSVDANTGFTSKGALSMADMYQAYNSYDWTYYYTPSVRRSVIADDFVYAISDSGIRVANIADLTAPLATVAFDPVTWQ